MEVGISEFLQRQLINTSWSWLQKGRTFSTTLPSRYERDIHPSLEQIIYENFCVMIAVAGQ
jgi:hypothetical protein